jgi:hypothetical protein
MASFTHDIRIGAVRAGRRLLWLPLAVALVLGACGQPAQTPQPAASRMITDAQIRDAVASLVTTHGEAARARIERGVAQVADRWRAEDGTAAEFATFCTTHFISDTARLAATLARFEENLMLIGGYLTELNRDLMRPLHLDLGEVTPLDELFGTFSPSAHVTSDMFATKLAFVALLNFPVTTLDERVKEGAQWSRSQWASARLGGMFASRVPSEVNQAITNAYIAGDTYISSYNIHMHGLVDETGARMFPEGLALITHWGLRDELKAQYAKEGGLARQRMIMKVMERIITQEIPKDVIDNPAIDWNPLANTVAARPGAEASAAPSSAPEPDTRYARWLDIFKAERAADAYHTGDVTFIDRKFNREREIPEKEVEALLVSVLSDPVAKQVGALVAERLGRALEPFDIWYNGFRAQGDNEDVLDRIVGAKYPNVAAFERDLPAILRKLGFTADKAAWLAARIAVDASRGAGHAMAAGRLVDKAHLRTRIGAGGMTYKGYNIAIHELGHNVEQTFSFQGIDHTLLRGVPNTAFTEGFAFVFQSRDRELLGRAVKDAAAEALEALNTYWATYEISGVALCDMRVWRWMYEHPDATPAELKQAVLTIAREVWNTYYAPVFGVKDVALLAIYSHTIDAGMYTPDYPMGHIIAFQIEQYLKTRNLAAEMERMCLIGSVSPDLWMRTAVGAPISTQPLLDAARAAIKDGGRLRPPNSN